MSSCSIDLDDSPGPPDDPAPDDYIAIASGIHHSLALEDNLISPLPTLWAWGNNEFGQLGDGTFSNKNKPVRIGYGYKAIAAGGSHSLVLDADTLLAWGDNRWGQIGDGTLVSKNTPVKIGHSFSSISGGGMHSLAVKSDGTLWAWGKNEYGQLGDGTNENRTYPVLIGKGFTQISGGSQHSIGLKDDGTLWAWGDNDFGQLGDGTNDNRNLPVMIGSSFIAIAAGGYHSLAWKSDGTLWTWGHNEYGQLGDETKINRNTPVMVLSAVSQWNPKNVAAGDYHSLAYDGGTVWSCGRNDQGQVGDGSLTDRGQWSRLNHLWNGIAAGGSHSFAIQERAEYPGGIGPFFIGHLWAWGSNREGQFGLGGVPYYSTTPILIGPM